MPHATRHLTLVIKRGDESLCCRLPCHEGWASADHRLVVDAPYGSLIRPGILGKLRVFPGAEGAVAWRLDVATGSIAILGAEPGAEFALEWNRSMGTEWSLRVRAGPNGAVQIPSVPAGSIEIRQRPENETVSPKRWIELTKLNVLAGTRSEFHVSVGRSLGSSGR